MTVLISPLPPESPNQIDFLHGCRRHRMINHHRERHGASIRDMEATCWEQSDGDDEGSDRAALSSFSSCRAPCQTSHNARSRTRFSRVTNNNKHKHAFRFRTSRD